MATVHADSEITVPEDMSVKLLCRVLVLRHPGAEIIAMWHDQQMQTIRLRLRVVKSVPIPQYDQAQIDAAIKAENAQNGQDDRGGASE